MRTARVSNVSRGEELARRARVADTRWTRLRGLLGRPEPEPGEGLLILPSRGVHMWGMRYPLDVILGDGDGRVVATYPDLQPWSRTAVHREAAWALELRAGTLGETPAGPGDEIRWEFVDEGAATAVRGGTSGRRPK